MNKNVTLEVGGAFVVLPADNDGFALWPIHLKINGAKRGQFFDVKEAEEVANKIFESAEYLTVELEKEEIDYCEDPSDLRIYDSLIYFRALPSFASPADAIEFLAHG
jgi:hypothetical protein